MNAVVCRRLGQTPVTDLLKQRRRTYLVHVLRSLLFRGRTGHERSGLQTTRSTTSH